MTALYVAFAVQVSAPARDVAITSRGCSWPLLAPQIA